MSDHQEEQEMEAEALEAIFMDAFEVRSPSQPFVWSVKLMPVDCGGDEEEENRENHVMVNLVATIPLTYPEETLPELDIEVVKGLSKDNKTELVKLANEEAEANEGMPAVFAVCERIKEWLVDNNVKGLDDASMHAQMMRKAKEKERKEAQAVIEFESQKTKEEMTQAESEELAVRKRREEGTPVTDETFAEWWAAYCAEMAEKKAAENALTAEQDAKDSKKSVAVEERLTGFQVFSEKAGAFDLDKLEAAAEQMENDLDVDEELFDDDEDLDDLDFDSDDEDDSDEEPDI